MKTQDETDAPPTEAELREAEALARALDGAPPAESRADLETVALLRQARSSESPVGPVPARVFAALDARRAAGRRRWRPTWLAPIILVPAGAALLLFLPVMRRQAPSSAPPVAAPAPAAQLLAVQAQAARGEGRALAALDEEMRRYRSGFYRALGGEAP